MLHNNIDWTNAIDKEAIIQMPVCYGVDLKENKIIQYYYAQTSPFEGQNHMIKLCYLYQQFPNIVVMTEK